MLVMVDVMLVVLELAVVERVIVEDTKKLNKLEMIDEYMRKFILAHVGLDK